MNNMKNPKEECIEALTDAIMTQDWKLERAVKLFTRIGRRYTLDRATHRLIQQAIKDLGKNPPRNLQGLIKK